MDNNSFNPSNINESIQISQRRPPDGPAEGMQEGRPGRPPGGGPGGPGRPPGGGPGGPGRPPGGPGGPGRPPGGGPGGPGRPPGGPGGPGGPGRPPGRPPQGPPPIRPGTPIFFPPPNVNIFPNRLRNCLFRFTYIWLFNGRDFWFYPIAIANNFLVGFRWNGFSWEDDLLNIRRIADFQCF